jgi:hypothetical protein
MLNTSSNLSDGSGVQGTLRSVHNDDTEKQKLNGGQAINQSTKEDDFERRVLEAVEIRVREGNSWRNKVFAFHHQLELYGELTIFSSHCT